jgi:phage terminase Nu1 subunit (DNA packaging protein)
MARQGANDEEITHSEAARRLGMTQQSVGTWASKPGAPVVMRKGKRYCVWPQFPAWHREQIMRPQKPADMDDAKIRKLAAEAELAELALEVQRGTLIPLDRHEQALLEFAGNIRAQLLTAPSRYAPRIVGLDTLPQAQALLDAMVRDVLQSVADGDGG